MKKQHLFLTLIVLVVVRFFIALTTPVFDTSEARYAAISANMARTNNFLVPCFTYDNVYQSFDGKPPLLFQTAGIACKVFGCREKDAAYNELRHLTDDIAHDLRTPLTRLSAAAEIELTGNDLREPLAVQVHSKTDAILNLINTMLEIR